MIGLGSRGQILMTTLPSSKLDALADKSPFYPRLENPIDEEEVKIRLV